MPQQIPLKRLLLSAEQTPWDLLPAEQLSRIRPFRLFDGVSAFITVRSTNCHFSNLPADNVFETAILLSACHCR